MMTFKSVFQKIFLIVLRFKDQIITNNNKYVRSVKRTINLCWRINCVF